MLLVVRNGAVVGRASATSLTRFGGPTDGQLRPVPPAAQLSSSDQRVPSRAALALSDCLDPPAATLELQWLEGRYCLYVAIDGSDSP
jgi:hypothetical protein